MPSSDRSLDFVVLLNSLSRVAIKALEALTGSGVEVEL